MTTQEFKRAFTIASSDQDLTNVNMGHLFGFGLQDFQPVSTTVEAVARMMRWQAHQMDGGWDEQALDEIRQCGRTKFIVIN